MSVYVENIPRLIEFALRKGIQFEGKIPEYYLLAYKIELIAFFQQIVLVKDCGESNCVEINEINGTAG
ncbi:MAG: hypothetical protein K8R25_13460 [Methanosarcinales archaeon]|nr:hypothetical protein [Methanosarcinales archaeon]